MEEGRRVKFNTVRVPGDFVLDERWRSLAHALRELEKAGCAPVLPDGKVGGNAALRLDYGILVSRSGRPPGPSTEDDFVKVIRFDPGSWTAYYLSTGEEAKPSSDTPLHWAALVDIPEELELGEKPLASVHGHALETPEAAEELGIPISDEETLFSTPPDREALIQLMRCHPYPKNKIWIRKGHGFFSVGRDVKEALDAALTAARCRTSVNRGLV